MLICSWFLHKVSAPKRVRHARKCNGRTVLPGRSSAVSSTTPYRQASTFLIHVLETLGAESLVDSGNEVLLVLILMMRIHRIDGDYVIAVKITPLITLSTVDGFEPNTCAFKSHTLQSYTVVGPCFCHTLRGCLHKPPGAAIRTGRTCWRAGLRPARSWTAACRRRAGVPPRGFS